MNPHARPWTDRLARAFAVDLRSLAVLRVMLGLILLVDTLSRLGDAGAFYSDAGVLPRALLESSTSPWRWSLHLANGGAAFQVLLLLAQAAAAVALVLGWRSRLAAFLGWLLLASLLNRNPLVLLAGDRPLCALLFWSFFLPLGARWSLDSIVARQPPPNDHRLASWAGVALILQLAMIFAQTPPLSGLDADPSGAGRWLLDHAALAQFIAAWIQGLRLTLPVLLLLRMIGPPDSRRLTALRALLLAQLLLAILITMLLRSAGSLPWLQLAGVLALVDGGLWDAAAERVRRRSSGREPLRIYYDRDCAFCLQICRLLTGLLVLPRAQLLAAQEHRRADSLARANHSWVVIDHDDTAHLKGAALLLLLRRSPLLGWVGALALRTGLSAAADAAYDAISRRSGVWSGRLQRLLPDADESLSPSVAVQRLAGALAILSLVANLSAPTFLDSMFTPVIQLLRLDVHADAPTITTNDRWVAAGHLGDGREVDALRATAPLRFSALAAPDGDSPRWQAWRSQLQAPEAAPRLDSWAAYLCRRWNRGLPADSPDVLVDFKLIELLDTQTGDNRQAEQRVLRRQDCAITPAT